MSPLQAVLALIPVLGLCMGFLKTWEWWEAREHRSWAQEALGVFVIGVGYATASLGYIALLGVVFT